MSLPSSSPAGQRFLASLQEGRGLRQSVRDAGVHQEVGYRWLKAQYLQLRRTGSSPAETVAQLGFRSSRMDAWEAEVGRSTRHHRRVDEAVEGTFWEALAGGATPVTAAAAAGVSRMTTRRWLARRFEQMRDAGASVRSCQRQLRLTDLLTANLENQWWRHHQRQLIT